MGFWVLDEMDESEFNYYCERARKNGTDPASEWFDDFFPPDLDDEEIYDDDWESPLVKSNHTLDRGNNKR